jgi:hypothetical protein
VNLANSDPQHCLQHPPPEVSLPPIRAMLPIPTAAPPEVPHQGRHQDLPTGGRLQPPQDGQAMRHGHPGRLGRGHLHPGLAIKKPTQKTPKNPSKKPTKNVFFFWGGGGFLNFYYLL